MADGRTPAFAGFEWMLSLRYLRPRRKQGFISVIAGFSFLGIVLGVATLIIVMAVMNGFRAELLGKILGVNGHFLAVGVSRDISDYDDLSERIRAIEGVNQAIPFVEGQVMASSPATATGAIVRGLSEASMHQMSEVSENLVEGTLEGFDEAHGVAIGQRLASKHRLFLGDNLTLISPRGPVTPFGVTPRIQPFEIVAIFEVGMSEYDGSLVFMSLADAQPYFNHENTVSAIEIKVEDPDDIDHYWAPLTAELAEGTRLTSWQQTNATFFNALEVERNVMFLILTLIVLVAALNIVSGLIMLVKDKGNDIAILRTMGATRGAIMRVFFITGAAIGVVGTFSGLIIGLLFCANIEEIRQFLEGLTGRNLFPDELYFLSQLPAKVDPVEVTSIVLMTLGLSFLATLYPSWRAARLDPVEALRYE